MTYKMNLKLQFVGVGLVAGLAAAGASSAAPLPKEGRYDTTNCSTVTSNRIDFSKTHWAQSFEQLGTTQSNPPGGYGDGSAYRCVGMNASIDGMISGKTFCESVDPDGDKRLSSFTQEGDKTVRTQVAGTGKYEGLIQSGDFVRAPAFPIVKPGTFQQCNRQTGTYKLK
jgi:hypothetical protein